MFNPYFRLSIDEALAHPFFKKVRKQEKEIASKVEVQIEFEKEHHLDKKKLRALFLEEIEHFKKRKESGDIWS